MKSDDFRQEAASHRERGIILFEEGKCEEGIEEYYQATRKALYAELLDGREPGLQRCIELNPKRVILMPEPMVTERQYHFIPRPKQEIYEQMEKARRAKELWREKLREKKQEESEEMKYPKDFKKNLVFSFATNGAKTT